VVQIAWPATRGIAFKAVHRPTFRAFRIFAPELSRVCEAPVQSAKLVNDVAAARMQTSRLERGTQNAQSRWPAISRNAEPRER
jgi:hypothetical protein